MSTKSEMQFSIFIIHQLAQSWHKTPVDVFKTRDMYFKGLWDKKRTIEELRYCKMNDQICIVKQEILNKILTFKNKYRV